MLCLLLVPWRASAQTDALLAIYHSRADLQTVFDPVTLRAISGSGAGVLLDLQDWAAQYGWKEYPPLRSFGPVPGTAIPRRINSREVESIIGSQAYAVIDRATGTVLTVKRERLVWPIASMTKLITASIVMDQGIRLDQMADVRNNDDVGGAKLYVNNGDQFTVNDLLYAALVASANNAANALSRTTGMNRKDFVSVMNARAQALNLSQTHFVDPTGIELGNVSTPLEFARLAADAFSRNSIQQVTTTATRLIRVANTGVSKKMINTNWMLWKPRYDDVWVTGGKTGYLDESGWNVVESIKPDKNDERELLIVLFGARSRVESFDDAKRLADWAWGVYRWEKSS